jgi:toxin ParE1/3/4
LAATIRFTPQALADLTAIRDWIAEDDARAADRVLARIRQATTMLGQFAMLGHEGSVPGTRELKVTGLPYLVVYALHDGDVDILTVMHSRRRYPPD